MGLRQVEDIPNCVHALREHFARELLVALQVKVGASLPPATGAGCGSLDHEGFFWGRECIPPRH